MICYVWIRHRVSENMYLSVLRVKDGGPVDMCFCCDTLLIFSSICVNMNLVLYGTVSLNSLSIRDSEFEKNVSVTLHSFCPSY